MRPGPALPLLAASLLATTLLATSARGHAVGLSQGEYRWQPHGLTAELVFARAELGEPATAAAQALLQAIAVTDESEQRCAPQLVGLTADETNMTLQAEYRCPTPTAALRVELRFWDELSAGHRHLMRNATPESAAPPALLQRESPSFALRGAAANTSAPSLLGWLRLGVEHILGGYDHLAFLLGLVLVAAQLRSLAALISLFTLAHSLTLALASLELYAPPSALVEAAIAASICYVGVENLMTPRPRGRAALVFGFGLIHGFGFAGALRELGVATAQAPLALLGFNLGVELGQLTLLAAAFPLLCWARRAPWFSSRGLTALNAAVALAGALWLCSRLLESIAS